LFTSIDESIIENTLQYLIGVYKEVSISRGKVQQYLGMLFDFSKSGKCYVTMPKFTEEVLKKGGVSGVAAIPALESLFVIREGTELLDAEQKEQFHPVVAMLQYLANV
jgi:hypothetical protein